MSLSKASINLESLQQNLLQLDLSAQRIRRLSEAPDLDLVREMVAQRTIQRSAEAQLNVIRVQNDVDDFIIDELA